MFASMAKRFAGDMVYPVTLDAVQIFGGAGVPSAKIYQIYEGTSQIQRLLMGKEMLSRATMEP
ncbi:hypothetical protein THRCLA_21865 [Thraustotheca clavata]|uniref:Acyl-CoA dehydrogenase/oxidase C-terminal domain-containing protein n=1 Tax=Thraustotheca clavata TaxID=74557 RepID=A0A1V9ZLL2_9STRA|nr:hypothetical protein THRCLA_21865 [Thraustotheca clavata]